MAKFRVKDTFTIEGRPLFVLIGSVVEGEIRAGMSVSLPLNSGLTLTGRIDSIEFARTSDGRDNTCLCIHFTDPAELEIWRQLEIRDETVDVTTKIAD